MSKKIACPDCMLNNKISLGTEIKRDFFKSKKSIFVDLDGYHEHDRSEEIVLLRCSEGHKFEAVIKTTCDACDFNRARYAII